MKGVIIAVDPGLKLYPLTKVTNKYLLPIYDKPMIYYPLKTLLKAGITDILIVLGGAGSEDIVKLLGSGKELGVNLTYKYKAEIEGIKGTLGVAEEFVRKEPFMVIMGDNIIIKSNLEDAVKDFEVSRIKAGVFLKEVSEPERFSIADVRDGQMKKIEKKPVNPGSNYAVTGIYLYHPDIFKIIKTMEAQNEKAVEIIDINNYFIAEDVLKSYYLKGYWIYPGKFDSLYKATLLVREANWQGGMLKD